MAPQPQQTANTEHARETVQQLFEFIIAQGDADYIGEPISQLEHSLQAAQLAQESGADDETILGALLHDVGRFIPAAEKMPKMIAPDGTYVGRASHEVVGEQYLRQLGFGEKVCQLVGAHVMAKRYLTAVDKDYYEGLSTSSKNTLRMQSTEQGGSFNEIQVREAQEDPWLQAKLQVRRWDDQAKVPDIKTAPLSAYEELAIRCLLNPSTPVVELHSTKYTLPQVPTVVVCVDGFDPEYLEHGIASGILPTLKSFRDKGFHATAKCAMPSFTNPNNVSIITGVPPSIHGIAGNYFLDRATKEERMIQDDSLLRGSTILQLMAGRGVKVAAVTAKGKLRRIIGHGLSNANAICFAAENASSASLAENGIENVEAWLGRPTPPQYSADLSLFVLDAGIKLLREKRAELLYLTLSDFVQHKYAPGEKEADEFFASLDHRLKELVDLGAVVAVTGDHGMSDKCTAENEPNILFLQDELEAKFGLGCAKVICPITDPFVRHHGALGSFVQVYLESPELLPTALDYCQSLSQVQLALPGKEGAEQFEIPHDSDIVVVAVKNAVIGSRRRDHDLTNLQGHRLRSHGGLSEQNVPLLMSRPVKDKSRAATREWRNYHVCDLVLNW
ncbi:alkaline-phosphatase-like protein [Aspergillus californicus]